jgi:exodeoxyribonuclease VII large subunit
LADRVSAAKQDLNRLIRGYLHHHRQGLTDLARTLNAVSPLETIGRGYAVVTSSQDGKVISSARQTQAGQAITTQLRDGRLMSVVETIDEKTLEPDPD